MSSVPLLGEVLSSVTKDEGMISLYKAEPAFERRGCSDPGQKVTTEVVLDRFGPYTREHTQLISVAG